MATQQQLVERYGAEPPPKPDPDRVPRRTVWDRFSNRWPSFDPPPIPRTGLTLDWLWRYVLDENMQPPTAEGLQAAADIETADFPECHGALYRRQHPDWLEKELEFRTELHSEECWRGIERRVHDNRDLPLERREWLNRHSQLLLQLVEEAKAEHVRKYGEGWLKKALRDIDARR